MCMYCDYTMSIFMAAINFRRDSHVMNKMCNRVLHLGLYKTYAKIQKSMEMKIIILALPQFTLCCNPGVEKH